MWLGLLLCLLCFTKVRRCKFPVRDNEVLKKKRKGALFNHLCVWSCCRILALNLVSHIFVCAFHSQPCFRYFCMCVSQPTLFQIFLYVHFSQPCFRYFCMCISVNLVLDIFVCAFHSQPCFRYFCMCISQSTLF